MNDLELLKRLPGPVDPLDEPTRQRIETLFDANRVSGRARRRRGVKVGVLAAAAAVVIAGSAAGAIHWSEQQPVAFPIVSPSDTAWGFQISDPNHPIATTADLQAAVSEFAPAIRLPDGGSFDAWQQHVGSTLGTNDPAVYMRGDTAMGMVHVSECQWGQRWLDASARGDQQVADTAVRVLSGVGDWWSAEGFAGWDVYMGRVLAQMRNGDASGIQAFEDMECAWTGSWGATPALQDAKATSALVPAISAAVQYLQDGGNPASFDPGSAQGLAPSISWTWSHEQPAPARPGAIFIAVSPSDVVTLVSVSETGTQFCAAVSGPSIVRGTTGSDLTVIDSDGGPHAVDPRPVTCAAGGW